MVSQIRSSEPQARKRSRGYRPVFRELLDFLDVGIAIVSAPGIILYSNPSFAEMVSARPLQRVRGADLKSFVSEGSWAALDQALRKSTHTRSEGRFEIQHLTDRRKRTLRVSLVPVTHQKSEPLIGIVATETTRLEQASKAETSLRSFSARLLKRQDEERRHLARDLHDTIGQDVAVAVMRLERIAKSVGPDDVDLRNSLTECSDWLRKVESETRTLSDVLHPPLLDQIGLVPALRRYIEGFSKRSGLQVELEVACDIPRLAVERETVLFRIAQESLTNTLRHSGSSKAHVQVALEGNNVRVAIKDKGRGFREDPFREKSKADLGVGIPGMRGRLSLVGGILEIQSTNGGTTVTATVPFEETKGTGDSDSYSYQRGPRVAAQETLVEPGIPLGVARVLVADDHEIARRGIRDLFRDEPDLEVCGEACDGIEALAKAEELQPDLLILDLSMPKMGGFSVANHLRIAKHPVKVLIYSSHKNSDIERMARVCGCRGCIHKANAARDLVRGARTVLGGGTFYEGEAGTARQTEL